MADSKLILVCKDKPTADDICRILVYSGNITTEDIECWEEKTWDVKRKTGPIHSKVLFVGGIKDTEPLSCFIDIKYERWGILYGSNPKYALITADTVYIKDADRYKAFMSNFDDALSTVLDPVVEDSSAKVAKVFGTVGLAVATGGASLAAQKIYDDNKTLEEKNRKLCLYGAWHFANNYLKEFLSDD